MAQPIEMLTDETFAKTTALGVVLVDFYADWCGPCRMLAPVLQQASTELAGSARVCKIDVEQAQQTAATLRVSSIPTMVLFKEGKEVGRLVGLKDKETIVDFVKAAL